MKLKLNSHKSRKGAFTLIEILLVLVIIGLVATALVVNLMPQQAGAERDAAGILIKSVKSSLNTYRLNIGHYPTEEEGGLLALLKKPEFENEKLGAKWNGPYVAETTTFEDSWGNQLIYEPADPEFKQPEDPDYRLFSMGPNGIRDDEDDIGDKEQQDEVDSLEELGEAGDSTTGNE
tara:strand:- start:5703 stop:6233 length:531 start_codon:yes stop_codon:yes gene_type:complete